MSAPKVGDRVHVQYDGTVESVSPSGDMFVQPDGSGSAEATHVDWCTVIVPPIALHDVVTAENIGQLPQMSVVCRSELRGEDEVGRALVHGVPARQRPRA